jgi:hypothetical protein
MMLAEASGMAQVMPLDETLDPTLGQMIFSLTAMVYIGFLGLINPIARNQWAHSQDSVFD